MQSNQKALDAKKKIAKQGDPVDAEELSRRLTAHLAEQNSKAFKRRFSAGRNDVNYRNYHKSSGNTSIIEGSPSKHDTRRTIHKISEPLIKCQRQLESKLQGTRRRPNHLKSPASCSQQTTEPSVMYHENHCQWKHNLFFAHGQDLEQNLYQSPHRAFHIKHSLRKLRGGNKPKWPSNYSHKSTEASRNSNEDYRHEKSNSSWLSQNNVTYRTKCNSPPLLKKMELSWASLSKKISRDQSSDEVSVGVPDISPPGSKHGLRSSIVALFRKNTNT